MAQEVEKRDGHRLLITDIDITGLDRRILELIFFSFNGSLSINLDYRRQNITINNESRIKMIDWLNSLQVEEAV